MDQASQSLDLLLGMVETASFARHARIAPGRDIPVVVLSGFLGSGKTTLMRHLLTGKHGLHVAAIANDFAALNIDETLVSKVNDDTMAMANGCICCSLSGSVGKTLISIAEREERPDAILIEASGVADPTAIAQVSASVPGISLDCVVSVVDGAAGTVETEVEPLLKQQIASADIILLNKIDLIEKDAAERIEAYLVGLAPRAQILRTINCAVPPVVIFDALSKRPSGFEANHDNHHHHAQDIFASCTIDMNKPVDRTVFERAMASLPDGIYRLKGFIRLNEKTDQSWLVQAVGKRWRMEAFEDQAPEHALVAIGSRSVVSEQALADYFAG